MRKKVKILKARGGKDASLADFKTPSVNKSVTAGGNNQKTTTGTGTQNTQNTGGQSGNQSSSRMIMPVTAQLAKSLIIDPIVKGVRQQKVKGENIFGKAVALPASRDYYRTTGKPIDVMSKEGTSYMKDAGLIKPTLPGGTPDNDPKQLCPDGTFPPCKTPLTQIKKPVAATNSFLSGFRAYDDGGEVVISSNVDKDLL